VSPDPQGIAWDAGVLHEPAEVASLEIVHSVLGRSELADGIANVHVGQILSPLRAGGRLLLRGQAYRSYIKSAAGTLARDLGLPPNRLERALKRARRQAEKRSPSAHIKAALLGGGEFSTAIDKIAHEFPDVLKDFPKADRQARKRLIRQCARALRGAVAAAPKEDVVAERVMEAQGSAERVRLDWSLVTAAVVSTAIAGVASGSGNDIKTHNTPESLVAGLVAAMVAGTTVTAWTVASVGRHARPAQAALLNLVDALLAPNDEAWKLPTWQQQLQGVPAARLITDALTRITARTVYGHNTSTGREFLCRWDGSERDAICAAAKETLLALQGLPLHPKWNAPVCVMEHVETLISSFSSEEAVLALGASPGTYEYELAAGKRVIEVLFCCAAVAVALDNALYIEVREAA
jgi:hypothetical protein